MVLPGVSLLTETFITYISAAWALSRGGGGRLSHGCCIALKVDGNEKLGGTGRGAINQVLSGIAAIGGYFKFECAVSL